MTLTFRDNGPICCIPEANKAFKKFIQRLRYHFRTSSFKYLAIIDFQELTGRQAIHYHLVTDCPFLSHELLNEIWGNGWTWIGRIRNFSKVENYLIKHLEVNRFDIRLQGHKLYLPSRNLTYPLIIRGKDAVQLKEILSTEKEFYSYYYENPYVGKGYCKKYFLFKLRRKLWIKTS